MEKLAQVLSIFKLLWITYAASLDENYVCDVNLCDTDIPEFYCMTGSIILIEEVMCRRGGDNCDELAFREVTRMCSGRQKCQSDDLWHMRGQFCLPDAINDQGQSVMSLVFVSYVCISGKALESNCSRRGVAVSPGQSYVSSPGYPALVIGSSVCTWRIHPPHGYDVDIYVREYLHVDRSDKLFVRVRELLKNQVGMKLERTSDRGLQFTMNGDVEILMYTHGAIGGHRVWIEYRFVRESTLDHLRPFSMPNRTSCGDSAGNITTTASADMSTKVHKILGYYTSSRPEVAVVSETNATTTKQQSSSSGRNRTTLDTDDATADVKSGTNDTAVQQEQYQPPSDLPIILASCIVGSVFTITLVCVVIKCRRRRKPGQSRSCFGTDTVSLASDRALLACTPTQGRSPFVITSGAPNSPNPSAGRGNNIMLSEELEIKPESSSPRNKNISVIDQHSYQGLDFNPIDFTKYIINNQQTNNDRQFSEHGV